MAALPSFLMPTVFFRDHRVSLVVLALFFFILTSAGMWFYLTPAPLEYDELLKKTLDTVPEIRTYSQKVETTVFLSDRKLHVEGMYSLNGPDSSFSSDATTTLSFFEGKQLKTSVFTLHNISIGNDVYVKVHTNDPQLQTTIPHSPSWRHFERTHIPPEFTNIAVSGPVLDNLLLLKEGGAYLSLIESHGTSEWNDAAYARYTFELSKEASVNLGGTLGSLMQRIGDTGTIDIWIDEAEARVKYMVFNGENYHSTTTISAINTPPIIVPPAL